MIVKRMTSGQAGKGDRYRYVDPKKWKENWEKAFGEKKKNKEKPKKKKDEASLKDL